MSSPGALKKNNYPSSVVLPTSLMRIVTIVEQSFWGWRKNEQIGTRLGQECKWILLLARICISFVFLTSNICRRNNVRTKNLIEESDIVVVRFGEKYRQWNAAFDAGYAAALGKSIITLHPPSISHMLKEVNANASVVCEDAEQVVDTLAYVIRGDLPKPRDGEAFIPIADRLGAGNPNP